MALFNGSHTPVVVVQAAPAGLQVHAHAIAFPICGYHMQSINTGDKNNLSVKRRKRVSFMRIRG